MSVSLDQLRSRMRDHRVVIVDVLSADAYANGHIPGAINLPVADIPRRAPAELPDRTQKIVVYCGGPT